MKPNDYFLSLTEQERADYAVRAKCSIHHMRNNLFKQSGESRKQPRPELLVSLAMASEGQVSLDEAIDYFLVSPVRKLAAELAAPSLLKHRIAKDTLPVNCFDNESGAGL